MPEGVTPERRRLLLEAVRAAARTRIMPRFRALAPSDVAFKSGPQDLVTLADILVREQHIGYSGNYAYTVPRQALLDAIGLTEEHIKQMQLQLVGRIEPRAAALGLGTASSNELYQQALSRANRELGRVTEQFVQAANDPNGGVVLQSGRGLCCNLFHRVPGRRDQLLLGHHRLVPE